MRRPSAGSAWADAAPTERTGFWLLLPWLLIAAVAVVELTEGPRRTVPHVGALLSPAPALAAIRGSPRDVLAVSTAAAAVAVVMLAHHGWYGPEGLVTDLVAVLVVSVSSLVAAVARERRDAQLHRMRRVAEAAQLAVLPSVPSRAGELRLAARYSPAESDTLIGGDLYDAVVGPDRTRLIIGDVRGKGLTAVRMAAGVLGAFREAAHYEAGLPAIAVRCSRAVARYAADEAGDEAEEVFVTAALVEIEGAVLRVVALGHPPPLLLTPEGCRAAAGEPLPPLGLVHRLTDDYPVHVREWRPGDRLLLYTDGIDEARDTAGRFFPLADVLHSLREAPTEELPDLLLEAVDRHTGRRLRDDAAVVAVEFDGAGGRAAPGPDRSAGALGGAGGKGPGRGPGPGWRKGPRRARSAGAGGVNYPFLSCPSDKG